MFTRSVAFGASLAIGLGAVAGTAAASPVSTASSAAPAVGGNIIQGGSFEKPVLGPSKARYPTGSTGITGWTVGARTVVRDSDRIWQADSGRVSVDLAGGAVYQVVPTVAGTTYTLGFSMGGNFTCGQSIKTMVVRFGGAVVATESFDDSHSTKTDMGWSRYSVQVVATSAFSKVGFTDTTPNHSTCGAALDSVSLTAHPPAVLPEAPDVALLGALGAAIVGGGYLVARRRQRGAA